MEMMSSDRGHDDMQVTRASTPSTVAWSTKARQQALRCTTKWFILWNSCQAFTFLQKAMIDDVMPICAVFGACHYDDDSDRLLNAQMRFRQTRPAPVAPDGC
jgi:hypothetical protein